MTTTVYADSTSVDYSGVGQKAFRNRLRTALGSIEGDLPESDDFWKTFPARLTSPAVSQTLVLADLANLVSHFQHWSVHDWTASVRRTQPYFVAFVRTQKDRECVTLVDDLLRASDMRLNVCNDAADWNTVFGCLNTGVSSIKAEGLLEVRYLREIESFWVHFGDGFAGLFGWKDLGLESVQNTLIPESASVNSVGTAIELASVDGDLFEIDSAAVRGVLDARFAQKLRETHAHHEETVGLNLRQAREAAGLTQPQLGKLTGLDQAVISRIERGRVRPRIDTLRRLASGMSLSVSELLSG